MAVSYEVDNANHRVYFIVSIEHAYPFDCNRYVDNWNSSASDLFSLRNILEVGIPCYILTNPTHATEIAIVS